jgi:hypothetical protein
MQEAGRKARLIAALAMAVLASAGSARAAADLPLQTVMSYLHKAGVDAPWSVEQHSVQADGADRYIVAYSDREDAGKHSCRAKLVELDMHGQGGGVVVDDTSRDVVYAFIPCKWTSSASFHRLSEPVDFARVEDALDSVMSAVDDPGKAKVTFLDEDMRGAFAKLRPDDFHRIRDRGNDPLTLCFFTQVRDFLSAPEILSAEVIPGNPPQIKVDICGYIDIVPVKQ